MKNPTITVKRRWSEDNVWYVCVKHDLYSRGTCDEYDRMLSEIDIMQPTPDNLYKVAKDIKEHSEGQTISNIMFLLEREAVVTTFEIDGLEDI